MKCVFSIPYQTNWGEEIWVSGDHSLLGGGKYEAAFPLTYTGSSVWEGEMVFPEASTKLTYFYLLKRADGTIVKEWGNGRILSWDQHNGEKILCHDYWFSPRPEEKAWFSSAFTRKEKGHLDTEIPSNPSKGIREKKYLQFHIQTPRLDSHMYVGVLGNVQSLGEWNTDKLIPLQKAGRFDWSVEIQMDPSEKVAYKYVLVDSSTGKIAEWEAGENRFLPSTLLNSDAETFKIGDSVFNYSSKWRGAGVALPVFSLRTHQGLGIGEFEDLRLLVDWAVASGLRLIQILPINDTLATFTWKDSYPYSAISVFALHPLYANLSKIAAYYGAALEGAYMTAKAALNAHNTVDLDKVAETKFSYFRTLYSTHKRQIWADTKFLDFLRENASWIKPYALFCHLRDRYKSADFTQWPAHSVYQQDTLDHFFNEQNEDFHGIGLYIFIQYHLHIQLLSVAEYAREEGIVLKGDIPIGIYRYSVDAWTDPHLFNMDGQAGAPPDFFSAHGQNWGFPTYRWEIMAIDGYKWWRERLQKMASYFDAYRIDHVLGFFRIWEIPYSMISGTLGRFNPSLPMSQQEIWQRSIPFEKDRFTLPYLRGHVLDQRISTHLRKWVEDTFLIQDAPGYYRFRSELDTQRSITARLDVEEQLSQSDKEMVKEALFSLMGEVLFVQDPTRTEDAYHPRFMIGHTQSFQELDPWVQDRLTELYNDYFFSRNENFWRDQGMTKLPAILEATDMLVCAEDLGMVPACVPEVLDELGILGLEIQRMPKENNGFEFISGSHNPYLSVFSSSSHDISPLRAWWEEDPGRTQRYFNQVLNLPGEAPQTCEPWLVEIILAQHLDSPSMWAIFPLQDLLALDEQLRHPCPTSEQINDPGNPQHYWRYRVHIPLEELQEAVHYSERLNSMVQRSNRNMRY